MLLSGFPGLSQLGVFAIAGLLSAAFIAKWILPTLIPMGVELGPLRERLHVMVNCIPKYSGFVVTCLGLSLTFLFISKDPIWETDVSKLSPISQESKSLDAWLRKELGASDVRDVMVIMAPTEQEVLEHSEDFIPRLDNLINEGGIEGYHVAAQYVPSIRRQHSRQAALPNSSILLSQVNQARKGLPFKSNIFDPFIHDVTTGKTLEPLHSQRFLDSGFASPIQSLLFQSQDQWIGLVTFRGVKNRNQLLEITKKQTEFNVSYLDLKYLSNRMITTYRIEMTRYLGLGALAIVILLLLNLRSPTMVLRVLIPVLTSAVTVAAVLHVIGERLSLIHLASLLLVVGIGLDYALIF